VVKSGEANRKMQTQRQTIDNMRVIDKAQQERLRRPPPKAKNRELDSDNE
jgi:hypothetical protein